ncbi:MAG TPA: hypothetical protein VLH79_16540 [Chthonomonadales bacterium]|nr:hypothetical protein [Chthonomonadales bacterium]
MANLASFAMPKGWLLGEFAIYSGGVASVARRTTTVSEDGKSQLAGALALVTLVLGLIVWHIATDGHAAPARAEAERAASEAYMVAMKAELEAVNATTSADFRASMAKLTAEMARNTARIYRRMPDDEWTDFYASRMERALDARVAERAAVQARHAAMDAAVDTRLAAMDAATEAGLDTAAAMGMATDARLAVFRARLEANGVGPAKMEAALAATVASASAKAVAAEIDARVAALRGRQR